MSTETTTPISSESLLKSLNWRYATKTFDPTRKLSEADWATLEKALILTPSSFGLQPWKFVVVTDASIRASLVPFSWGQRQVVDASHLVVFAVKTLITEADITEYVESMASIRNVPVASLDSYKAIMVGLVLKPDFPFETWVANQAYIALGNLMTSAALLGIDTCPMEGFDPQKYDEILGFADLGLHAAVVCPVGYRSPEDAYAGLAKVRFPANKVVLHV